MSRNPKHEDLAGPNGAPGAPSSYVEKTRSDTLLRVSRWLLAAANSRQRRGLSTFDSVPGRCAGAWGDESLLDLPQDVVAETIFAAVVSKV